MLPVDGERRAEAQVSLAFASYAMVHPAVGYGLRDNVAQLRIHVAGRIRDAGYAGDADLAAAGLLALVDGLAVHVLGAICTADEAMVILDGQLATLLGSASGA